MRAWVRLTTGAALVLTSTMASADACEDLRRGTYGVPWSSKKLLDLAASSTTTKDEFETSENYAKRAADLAEPLLGAGDIMVEWPLRRDGLAYDADRGVFLVKRSALPTECGLTQMFTDTRAQAVTFGERTKYSVMSKSFCFEQEGTLTRGGDTYDAQNALGAKVRVTPVNSEAFGIFFGFAGTLTYPWAGEPGYVSSATLMEVPADVATAKSLKVNAIALIVLRPVPPFYFSYSLSLRPTFSNPISGRSTRHFVTADIQCVALADSAARTVLQTVTLAHKTSVSSLPPR